MTTNHHTPLVDGQLANAATFNAPLGELDEAITNLSGGTAWYGVAAYRTTALTIGAPIETVFVELNAEYVDTSGYHDGMVNADRLTVPMDRGGYYRVYFTVIFRSDGSGDVEFTLQRNGATQLGPSWRTTPSNTDAYHTTLGETIANLAVGQYVVLKVGKYTPSDTVTIESVTLGLQWIGS